MTPLCSLSKNGLTSNSFLLHEAAFPVPTRLSSIVNAKSVSFLKIAFALVLVLRLVVYRC